MEIPSEPALSTRVDSDVHADDHMPAWRVMLPLNGRDCQAAGVHVDKCERWTMADLSVPGANLPTVCSAKTILDIGLGITAMSTGVVQNLTKMFPDDAVTRMMDSMHSARVTDGRPLQATEMTCPGMPHAGGTGSG